MKKNLSLVGLVCLLLLGQMVMAGPPIKDPNAKKVLDAASEKFQSFKSFKIEFQRKLESKATGMNEEINGTALFNGQKFFLKMPGTEIYNNGKTVWTFFPDDNEVNISSMDEEDNDMSVEHMINMYKSGYKYQKLEDEVIDGVTYEVVDLEPDISPEERKTNQVFKIRMKINKKTKIVRSWKIFERNGNRYTVTIKGFTPNVKVSDSDFEFDKSKHKGIIVEDLR